jgi:hypothetical protein
MYIRSDARYVEAGEDRVITELVGEHPPLLLEYVRDHNVSTLGDEACRFSFIPALFAFQHGTLAQRVPMPDGSAFTQPLALISIEMRFVPQRSV